MDKNIVEKSGAWFSYSGTRIGQGRENVKQFLAEHPDMASEIELKVRQASGLTVPNVPVAQNPAPAAEKETAPPAERSSKSAKAQKTEKHVEA